MEQLITSAPANERAGDALAPATVVKRLIAGGLFAFVMVVLTGCVTILPQWQPTQEISRQDASQPITDTNPIIVQSGNERFILFIGATTAGNNALFLQRMNAAGALVGSPAQLTSNPGAYDQPRMAEQDGWLYVVWRYRAAPYLNSEVWWARVSTATLAYAAGPIQVSAGLSGDSATPDLAVRAGGTSVVVWANSNPISQIYYRQVVSDSTFASAPVIVSQGVNCAGVGYHQRLPRVQSAWYTPAQIAWIGDDASGGSRVYWRSFDNGSSSAISICFVLSDPYIGDAIDLDMAINPLNGHSYVAWTHRNAVTNDLDVYYRRVRGFSSPTPCQILNLSNAITTTSEGGVRIAAGHAVSNWVHLVWERYDQTAGQGAIRYALVQDDDCSATPTRITPSGNVALSVSPVPASADVGSPRIAVAQNAVIMRPNTSGGGSLMIALNVRQAALPGAALPTEGVFDEWSDLRPAADMDGQAREAENTSQPVPPLDCAADPKQPRCVEIATMSASQFSTMSAQVASAASSFRCGAYAADAVVVSFFDESNSQMYAALFQAGEVLNGSSCVRVVSAMYPSAGGLRLQALLRTDYSAPSFVDYNDHFPFISARGLPTVAWRGREPAGHLSVSNDEIYVAEGKFPAYVPIARRP